MSFEHDTLRPAVRLALLRDLASAPGSASHEYQLRDRLDLCGYRVAQELVHAELQWLQTGGLLTLDTIEGAYVASLTQRGADVADGRLRHDGVTAPRPGQRH